MEICFGKVSRNVPVSRNVDQLWSTIVSEIPGLAPHRDGLQMRYIDDEGDDICVTTDDELQEALCVGEETSKGILSLNLSVTGMGSSTRTSIEETVYDDESTEDEAVALPPLLDDEEYEKIDAPPAPPRGITAKPTEPETKSETTDVLQIIQSAGASAISEINQALNSAQSEMNKLLNQLGSANTAQKETVKELEAVKAELAEANSQCSAGEQKVLKLTHDLNITKALLSDSTEKARASSIQVKELEKQVLEKTVWENKYAVAEKERSQLEQQLTALRSALQALTMPQPATVVSSESAAVTKTTLVAVKAKPVTAEVVSTEILPPSPVVKPAASPELPPRYEESAPIDKERLEVLAQLKQLQDMGFKLTLGQLKEKLQQHSGNMEHVVHSLLR